MTYSQKANPNATNSELESKRIITHKELTSLQKNELIAQYVQLCVDSMDMECLLTIAEDHVTNYCEKLSDSELKERVECFDDDGLYEELVDNVTTETNNQGGQS